MDKELEIKVELRRLAIRAAKLEIDIFYEQDSEFIDNRIVKNKERAIRNAIVKIAKLTDAPVDRLFSLIDYDPFRTWHEYFDELRAIGVPIATQEEVEEYENRVIKK